MATLTTRAGKGSALTHNELDANFKRTVSQKTTTYSVVEADNRSVIECNSATPFTVTLGAAATMAAADTGDFEVTITNIGTGAVTVARAGSDTIDGVATSKTIKQYGAITFKVNSAGSGYSTVSYNSSSFNKIETTTDGTVEASKAIIADANKDTTGHRNITATGTVTAANVTATGTVTANGLSLTTDLSVANGGTGASTENSARENLGIYHGRVNAAGGAIRLPAGWSSARNTTGVYTITHNLGTANYSITGSAHIVPAGIFLIVAVNTNSVQVSIADFSGLSNDEDFDFIIIKD